MEYIEPWRELALARARESGLPIDRFQAPEGMQYWWFGTHTVGEKIEHVYFELWASQDQSDWEIFGATFCVYSSGVHVSAEPIILKPMQEKGLRSQALYFFMLSPGGWTKYNCAIQIKTFGSRCSLSSIDVSAFHGPSWKPIEKTQNVIWRADEAFSDTNDAMLADIGCPTCQGRGTKTEFSIPKADFANALSGYDRYSCNQVCSTVACITCGGKGVRHEKWYVEENREIRKGSKIFREGSGIVKAQRLPSIWESLKSNN